MKLYAIIFLLFINLVSAQDFEPSNMSFTYTIGSDSYLNQPIDIELFEQEDILTGFIWGHSNTFVDAFETNAKQGNILNSNLYSSQSITKSIIQPGKDGAGWNFPASIHCPMFHFEPTLEISELDDFETIENDPSNPVFGFSHINEDASRTFFIDQDDNNKRHYRVVLEDNEFNGSNVELILDKVTPNDKFISINASDVVRPQGGLSQKDYHQTTNEWILSINLRRMPDASSSLGTDPVLTLVMPYVGVDPSDTFYVTSSVHKLSPLS